MKTRFHWKQKLRYQFDNFMAKGVRAQLIGLTLATLLLVVVLSCFIFVLQLDSNKSLWGVLWETFTGVLKPKSPGWMPGQIALMLVKLLVLLASMLFVSVLIGILTSGFHSLVLSLGEGRSLVPVEGHTLILGWTPALPSLLRELILAKESERKAHIVILADREIANMEEELRQISPLPRLVHLVARRGDPNKPGDLALVNIDGAKSVVILPPLDEEEPDIEVIKILMAIVNQKDRRTEPYHLVTSIRDPKNIKVAQLASRGEVELIPSLEVISKITAQTCRQSGLPVVYSEMMSFEGNEMYFVPSGELAGQPFERALLAFDHCVVMGLIRDSGEIVLNPSLTSVLEAKDQIIVLAEDDSTVHMDFPSCAILEETISNGRLHSQASETITVVGWNAGASIILRELDLYVEKGSVARVLVPTQEDFLEFQQFQASCQSLRLDGRVGDPTDRGELDGLAIETSDHVIVLKYDSLSPSRSDARVLVSLLHVRDILEQAERDIAVVSELVIEQNCQLARTERADDFIVGNHLVGLLCSQVAENKDLNRVFNELLSEDGSEIYLKPIEVYAHIDAPLNFATLVESARRKGELALGYRRVCDQGNEAKNYGVCLNPDKHERIQFQEGDLVVVLAEDFHQESKGDATHSSSGRSLEASFTNPVGM